jgi:hypothetical protein
MGKRWRAPKGVGVVYKGKGFRKKANPGQRSSDNDERDEESDDEE